MEVTERRTFLLGDPSGPGEVRRVAAALAARMGCGEADVGRVRLVATEAATNVVKHGHGGELLLHGARDGYAWAVTLVALDRGPGLRDVPACFRDGMSTAGSPGTGLGAIRRLSTVFDLHSSPAGTVLFAELRDGGRRPPDRYEIGTIRVPYPGEPVCGDDVAVVSTDDGRCFVLVADGLGHGLAAAEAAEEATRLFRTSPGAGPVAVVEMLHDGLRSTRGAAAAAAEIDTRHRLVRFAGIGNIAASVQFDATLRSLVSHHGTLGHRVERVQEFTYPFPERALLVIHSDGLSARWDLSAYPGLASRHAMVVAGVLYRDFARRTDDASVVVVREAQA